jgi:hypothetical protein
MCHREIPPRTVFRCSSSPFRKGSRKESCSGGLGAEPPLLLPAPSKGVGAGSSGRDRQAADMAGNLAGSRNVEVYEKVEQVGEGTYGCATPAETQAECGCGLSDHA